jgi:hypothetical protein
MQMDEDQQSHWNKEAAQQDKVTRKNDDERRRSKAMFTDRFVLA